MGHTSDVDPEPNWIRTSKNWKIRGNRWKTTIHYSETQVSSVVDPE